MAYGRLVGINSTKPLSNCSLPDSGAVWVQDPGAVCTSGRSKPAGIFEAHAAEV